MTTQSVSIAPVTKPKPKPEAKVTVSWKAVSANSLKSGFWSPFRARVRRCVRGWWAWELISATVSVLATTSLIILLKKMDQSESRTWAMGNTDLTLNTIVAGISTIMRASLLLAVAGALNQHTWNWFASKKVGSEGNGQPLKDMETFSEAAANIFNCFALLWRTKCRYLVSLGALIMILSIAFDVFTQQVLTINTRLKTTQLQGSNVTEASLLSHTLSYNAKGISLPSTLNKLPLIEQDFSSILASGFSSGLLVWNWITSNGILRSSIALPDAYCPGLTCNWPVTPTIGVCSECATARPSSETVRNSSCKLVTYTLPLLNGSRGLPVDLDTCDPTVLTRSESDPSLLSNINFPDWRLDFRLISSNRSHDDGPNHGFPTERNTTAAIVYMIGYKQPGEELEAEADFFVHKCNFHLCVQGFSASSSRGSTKQRAASSSGGKAHWEPDETGDESLGWWIFDDIPEELNLREAKSVRVAESVRALLGDSFENILTGWKAQITGQRFEDAQAAELMWTASSSFEIFNDTMRSLADLVTTYIRMTGSTDEVDEAFAPTADLSVLIVGVRWIWLVYPLTLLFAGLLFLGLTMYSTARRNVRPWKGHRVPLLLARLDDSVQAQAQGGLSHRTGTEDRVGDINVRLEFDGKDSIRFRQVY